MGRMKMYSTGKNGTSFSFLDWIGGQGGKVVLVLVHGKRVLRVTSKTTKNLPFVIDNVRWSARGGNRKEILWAWWIGTYIHTVLYFNHALAICACAYLWGKNNQTPNYV